MFWFGGEEKKSTETTYPQIRMQESPPIKFRRKKENKKLLPCQNEKLFIWTSSIPSKCSEKKSIHNNGCFLWSQILHFIESYPCFILPWIEIKPKKFGKTGKKDINQIHNILCSLIYILYIKFPQFLPENK